MASAPFTASLQSRPGNVQRAAPKPITPPAMTAPAMPALPQIDDARAPNALGRQLLTQQLGNLPGLYNPQFSAVRGQAQEALAGYGGWRFADDDPSTAAREDLAVPTRDPSKGLGAREQQAVHGQRAQYSARGMLDSSFANRAVGAAIGQLNEEAKGIVRQYAAGISGIIDNQRERTTDIITDMVRLYGEDARWLAENPPPKQPSPFEGLPEIPGVTVPAPEPTRPNVPQGATVAPGSDSAHQNVPELGPLNRNVPGMGSPQWDRDPGLSPRAVEARWGRGARIIRAGNGKYVVRAPGGGRL